MQIFILQIATLQTIVQMSVTQLMITLCGTQKVITLQTITKKDCRMWSLYRLPPKKILRYSIIQTIITLRTVTVQIIS